MELLTLSYLQEIIYYALFHADASLQRGSSVRRRQSIGGSAAIPRPGGRQRTHKYTIVHDVLFVVNYIKLNCFTCIYLINNLYVSIFTGSPRHSMLTYALAGEMSGSHSSSTLCACERRGSRYCWFRWGGSPRDRYIKCIYLYFFQLSVPLIYVFI